MSQGVGEKMFYDLLEINFIHSKPISPIKNFKYVNVLLKNKKKNHLQIEDLFQWIKEAFTQFGKLVTCKIPFKKSKAEQHCN